MKADYYWIRLVTLLWDEKVARDIGTRFSAEYEPDFPKGAIVLFVFYSNVQGHLVWESADQLSQFGLDLPSPGLEVSSRVEG